MKKQLGLQLSRVLLKKILCHQPPPPPPSLLLSILFLHHQPPPPPPPYSCSFTTANLLLHVSPPPPVERERERESERDRESERALKQSSLIVRKACTPVRCYAISCQLLSVVCPSVHLSICLQGFSHGIGTDSPEYQQGDPCLSH